MKQIFTFLAAVVLTASTFAQVGIGTTEPNGSAALDITSTTGGLLVPRMTADERDAIPSPAQGLMIFCTDCASGEGELQVYYVSGWKNAANTVLDTTPPVISVTAGTDTVEQGATWTDAGATSDGDETVTVSGTIETSTAGTYTITYTATDTAGNVGTAKRIVTVLDTTTIPVILIKWNDLDFETEVSFGGESRNGTFTDVYNLLNGDNYNYPKNNPEDTPTGSAKEYFKTISHGSWNPKWEIINASDNTSPSSLNEYAYNINGNHINYGETNDYNGTALKPQLLAAYNKAVINYGSENFDKLWGKQNIIFIHSGYGAETPVDNRLNYVWSHKWNFSSNGETIKYAISPYKKENSVGGVKYTNIIPINWTVQSTLNHFGLPDLYDTDFSSKGAGYLSVIASGSWGVDSGSPWLPALASPYTRSKLSRFFTANISEINDTATDLSLPPINITDKSYKLTIPGNTNEYWLLENKKAAGFDRKLNEEGIVIWHVVENVNNNNNNEFPSNKRGESGYKMSLEASDGLFNLERKKNNFNGSRLWTTGQEFSPYSSPSSVMENGNPTGIRVYNIRKDGDNMLFDVEYITEPFNTITNIDLNTTSKILTITTTGLIGKSLEIGFNNNDYKSVNVSSETMEIDLKNEPYLTLFNNNITVNQNNGFNTLNIRAAADSFTNDMSGRPFSYNYTFEFIGPETPVPRTSQIKPSAKGLNQNEDKMIKFKQTNKK